MGARRGLTRARRLVVKVGSGQITNPGEGLDAKRITALAADIASLVAERREVVLVSSGAIAAGTARLGLSSRRRSIPETQAAAAVGQSSHMWLPVDLHVAVLFIHLAHGPIVPDEVPERSNTDGRITRERL